MFKGWGLSFLISGFICVPCLAFDEGSFVCSDNSYTYKGVTCCTSSVTKHSCESTIDQSFSEQVFEGIDMLQESYKKNEYEYGRVPNCFWNVLNFKGVIEENTLPYIIESQEFLSILKSQNLELEKVTALHQLQKEDVIVFKFEGLFRGDEIIGGKRRWSPYEQVVHAGVSLGGGLIFQKENIGTDAFSIDGIEHSRRAYERSINKLPLRGKIVLYRVSFDH